MKKIKNIILVAILAIVSLKSVASSAKVDSILTKIETKNVSTLMNVQIPPFKGECVHIYYDLSENSEYWIGKAYSVFLQNLMGHFPEFQQIVSPIERYKKGDIEKCHTSFYVGSYFNNKIPTDFFVDFEKTKKNVVWMGYNIWMPGLDWFEKQFGYKYEKLTTLNKDLKDEKGRPTFFKNVIYKGETFFKFGEWSLDNKVQFMAPFENTELKKTVENTSTTVLAEIVHNGTGDKLPYILRNKNKFYVADVPFSYIHEADRYMVIADLLFDALDAKPRHNGKFGLVRMEDIHPEAEIFYMYDAMKVLKSLNVPIEISLVPYFYDPLGASSLPRIFTAMNESPRFMQLLNDAQKNGAEFIWHGVTHQYRMMKNPHSGMSGDDFEFWDAVNNTELPDDTPAWVLRRMEDGLKIFKKAGLDFVGWLTPHYQASAKDYIIFGKIFEWNFGRVIYFNHDVSGFDYKQDTSKLLMHNKDPNAAAVRQAAFNNLQVTVNSRWQGQLYPYEIYGDVYGQRLIPENLGNSQPYRSDHVVWPRTVEDVLADASRNRVIRDSWASLFYHPYLFQTVIGGGRGAFPGDTADLTRILSEIKKMGYNFVPLKSFMQSTKNPIRPEPIYIN
jgi:uncharacterized protein YdaL